MSRPLLLLCAALLGLAGLAPIAWMLARIESGDLAGVFDARTLTLLLRTSWIGAGSALLAFALGLPFGFLVARTDLPLARFLRHAGLVPLLIPPVLLALTLAVVFSELRGPPAIVCVLGISAFPLVAVFSARACERIDARREEAALQAGGLRSALRMELPLVLPAAASAACLAFVLAINDFAVPDYMTSVGPKVNVYADEVFASWQSVHSPGKAVAAALPLLGLTLLVLLPALALRRRGSFETWDGDFRRPAPLALGAWRWPLFALAAGLVALTAALPIGRLVWEAGGGARGWSLGGLEAAFARAIEVGREDLQRSLLYSSCAALVSLPLGLVLGHALQHSRAGVWLEPLVLAPLAVPAILFGIGCIALWNRPATAAVYSSGLLVVLLFVGRFACFPVFAGAGASATLDPRLEEAARLANAGPVRRLVSIVQPALRGSLVGGAALAFVFGMRELDAAILVPAANGTAMFRVYNAIHFGRDDFVAALALLIVFFILLPGILWSTLGRERWEVQA
jgi:iron(III) transport system permease protein